MDSGGNNVITPVQAGELEGVTVSEWIASRLWVDYGTPFTFDGRPYLKKIHDLEEKKILFRTGRQVEKTSSLAAKLVSWSCLYQNWKSLYVSPSQNQTRVFSHARLDRVLNSPYVQAKYFDPQKGIDFVYEKQLMNGSSILLNYCSTEADRCVAVDSKVLRANGEWVPIEKLIQGKEYGAELVTFSEKRNRLSTGKITAFHLNGHRRIGRLVLEGGIVLRCTPDHKVWTQAMRWVQAEKAALNRNEGSKGKRVAAVINGSIQWLKAIDFIDGGEYEVADMTMSNDYSYVCSSVVVHNCRGISADMLLADEIQDMTHDVFPVLEEVLSHSPHGYKIYAGTPKTLNNAMETHWKNSTQCEWLVWCPCGKWIFQDEKIIRKEGPTCPECGKGVDPQFGKWVPYGPEDSEFMGFRIPQTMVPWISAIPYKWKELLQKLEKWPQQQFYNEVLGLAHEKGANPISESDIKKCCGSRQILEHKPVDLYFDALYAGVDWGAGLGSYTVLTIGGWHGSKFHIVYMKRFVHEKDEPGVQVEAIANTAARFGCPIVGCDWGGGYAQNSELSLLLTGKSDVIQLYESGVKKRNIDYQKKSRMYTFNRNMGLAKLFLAIHRQEIVFPRWEDTSEFAEDITCIFEDYNRTLRMLVYDHPEKMPDDTAHSIVFCMCAWKIARGDKSL